MLGILGGLGPRASAEFVNNVYRVAPGLREQQLPRVVLYSDPSFPDRTEAFLEGETSVLRERLVAALEALRHLQVTHTVICCVTMHHLLPQVPEALRRGVVSLVDLALEEVAQRGQPHVLLCSSGTRRMGVFQRSPRWEAAAPYVLMPSARDQEHIHAAIYYLKRFGDVGEVRALAHELRQRYGAHSWISGCTEFHLIHPGARLAGEAAAPVPLPVDPLWTIVQRVAQGLS